MTQEQVYKTLYAKKKQESLEKLKQYPVFYWAKKFHRNTRDERMEFKQMCYLAALYKTIHQYQKVCIEKSVQCGISELLVVESHSRAVQGLTIFYVLPKYEIRNRFVNNRIHRLHRRVGYYANLVRAARVEGGAHRTSLMHFGKGAIAFVGSNVEDEFIEIPVDIVYVDEKDRCNQQNLLLVSDRLTASPYKIWREVSNPTIEGFGIDERYSSSTQGRWNIKCEACSKWFEPNFFEHMVREVAANLYEARDAEYEPYENEARLIHSCGAPVNHLKKGEWIHEHANREWVGFRISKLFNKHVSFDELIRDWNAAVGHELKTQVFMNSNLGIPFSSKGARVHEHVLNECKRKYQYPVPLTRPKVPRVMGVDVGEVLHVILREFYNDAGLRTQKLLLAVELNTFEELAQLIRAWQPRVVVIDAMPEIHEVSRLKKQFNNMWASQFQQGKLEMGRDRLSKIVKMDRTSILDFVRRGFDEQTLVLPETADTIPNYYSQLQASTRVLEIDENNLERSRFVWRHTRPDHFFLAEAYCMQAVMMVPSSGVLDYYASEINRMKKGLDPTTEEVLQHIGEEKTEEELKRTQQINKQQFLSGLDKTYRARPTIVRSTQDVEGEVVAIAEQLSRQDVLGFTLRKFNQASGLRGEKGREFLLAHGYVERGGDVFVKEKASSKKEESI